MDAGVPHGSLTKVDVQVPHLAFADMDGGGNSFFCVSVVECLLCKTKVFYFANLSCSFGYREQIFIEEHIFIYLFIHLNISGLLSSPAMSLAYLKQKENPKKSPLCFYLGLDIPHQSAFPSSLESSCVCFAYDSGNFSCT